MAFPSLKAIFSSSAVKSPVKPKSTTATKTPTRTLRGSTPKTVPVKAPSRTAVKVSSTKPKTSSRPATKITGLSLRQLMKATPPYVHNNAKAVIIRELKPAVSRGGLPGIKAKILSVGNRGEKHQYRTTIVGKEADLPVYKQRHVVVQCQCEFFKFYCEYALNHWGSASIKYSNGEAPGMTNPGLLPLLCKHLVQLAKTVIDHKM